jgi:hypothetical protein
MADAVQNFWRKGMVEQEAQERRFQISVGLEEPVRSQLEAAARRYRRSVSGEAAYRIAASLKAEQSAA